MKEYIDRELLLKETKEYRENDPWWAIRRWWDAYRRRRYFTLFGLVVSKFPAADVVEVRHAKWVSSKQYNGNPECSACFYVTDEKTNYCPNCGAIMDEPKSITRPELPEPETVTYGEYVEVTELLAMPDEVLIPFITDIQKLCSRLNSYNHFAERFLKEE